MSLPSAPLTLGQKVPEFELVTYDPVQDEFGSVSLAGQMANKPWTILSFYVGKVHEALNR